MRTITGCEPVSVEPEKNESQFFGSLPTHGVWTAVGLSRSQFLLVISVSVLAFLFLGGPLWQHLDTNHFHRIVLSYLAIPVLILAIQLARRQLNLSTLLGGTIVIGVIKLLLTAVIMMLLSFV